MIDSLDYTIYADCTPLYQDIEWDPVLAALQVGADPHHHEAQAVGAVKNPPAPAMAPLSDDEALSQIPNQETDAGEEEGDDQALTPFPDQVNGAGEDLVARRENPSQKKRRGRPPKRTRPNPKPKRNHTPHRINQDSFQLPIGWIEDKKTRRKGRNAGHVDTYYVENSTGHRCRSRVELLDYISLQQRNEEAGRDDGNGDQSASSALSTHRSIELSLTVDCLYSHPDNM